MAFRGRKVFGTFEKQASGNKEKKKLTSYGLAQTSINEDRSVELNLPSIERIVSGEVFRTCEKMG